MVRHVTIYHLHEYNLRAVIQAEGVFRRRRYAERPPRNSVKCTSGVSKTTRLTRTLTAQFLCTTRSNLRPITALSDGAPCLRTLRLRFSCLLLRRHPRESWRRPATKAKTTRYPLLPLLLLSRPPSISPLLLLHATCNSPWILPLYPRGALWGLVLYTFLPFSVKLPTAQGSCRY